MVNLSISGDCLDMGTVIAEEYKEETFKVIVTMVFFCVKKGESESLSFEAR